MLHRLWGDDRGFVISSELVLVATLCVIGLIVGLVCVRNQVVQELVDVGQSVGSVSQSYAYSGVFGATHGCYAWSDGGCYVDLRDFCQASQTSGTEPGGISVRVCPVGCVLHTPPGGEMDGGSGCGCIP